MKTYVGLDVSLKETSVCIVDETGAAVEECVVVSDPDHIAEYLAEHAPMAQRVGLESGPTSIWLCRELDARGLPAICIDARHASAAQCRPVPHCRCRSTNRTAMMPWGWHVSCRPGGSDGFR